MFVIIGILVVLGGVAAGFSMAGGNLMVLIQIPEFVTLGAATIGSILVMGGSELLVSMIKGMISTLSPHGYNKQDFLEILKSFNDLFLIAQRDGLIAIEKHIESAEASEILSRNKKFISNEQVRSYFCDTLRVMLSGGVPPHEIEALMDSEIETFEAEKAPLPHYVTKIADAFPGLGIVAAVLGIIVTMGSINDGAEAVGHHVAAALVGTFLGILMSYGILGPIATNMEHAIEGEVRFMQTIKACVVAYAKGNPPIISVEIARRTIFSHSRPSFSELENYIRGK